MLVALTGARGNLGQAFLDFFREKGIEVIPLFWESFSLQELFKVLEGGRVTHFVNTAAISNREYSREHPLKTYETNVWGVAKQLEIVRLYSPKTRYLNFGSVYEFDLEDKSSYTTSKRSARQMVESYRAAGLWCTMPWLGLTEYYGRGKEFLTKKIVRFAVEAKRALDEGRPIKPLVLRDIDQKMRWSWAPDVVEKCWETMQGAAEDEILEGEAHRLSEFVELALAAAGIKRLRWCLVDHEHQLCTEARLFVSAKNSGLAEPDYVEFSINPWRGQTSLQDMIGKLIQHEAQNTDGNS